MLSRVQRMSTREVPRLRTVVSEAVTDPSANPSNQHGASDSGHKTGDPEPTGSPDDGDLRWVKPLRDSTDEEMAAIGLSRVRTLLQMRCTLPLPDAVVARTRPIEVVPFDREQHAEQFLGVNNRAFHWHPEQGGWDLARLDSVLAEDWYDPDGFLLHTTDQQPAGEGAPGAGSAGAGDSPTGVVDGFCWTKVHEATDTDPALGEIYAIGVDPSAHRSGLGRSLVVAGLSHLSAAGLGHGMLYVEHDNTAAVSLYEDLGFWVHERMGGYR